MLFVSAESMQSLSPDKAVVVKTMPKQLPKGVSLENLEAAATNLKRTMMIVVVVQLIFKNVL